jgi:hypothetical protein
MAFDVSNFFYEEYKKNKYFLVFIQIKSFKFINKMRIILKKLFLPFYILKKNHIKFNKFINSEEIFLEKKYFFEKNSYCFIDNPLDDFFYKKIKKNFPAKIFFSPMKTIDKQYNFGFKWVRDKKNNIQDYELFNEINSFFLFLKSITFQEIMNNFCNDGKKRSLFSFTLTIAAKNSILFPHKDSIANLAEGSSIEKKNTAINLIFFIKGKKSGRNIGATGIYEDNLFLKPIFIPENINNSLLIYKSDANFYHGFNKMESNSERFTVNAQYCS